MAEPVVVTHQEIVHPESTEQDLVDESFGAEGGECRRKRQHGDEIDARLGEDLEFFVTDREEPRCSSRVHHLERVRIERNKEAVHTELARARDELAEYVLVTAMYAIEAANGGGRASDIRGEPRP